MTKKLNLMWTKHLHDADERQKDDFENAIRNSTVCLTRLRNICYEYLEEIENDEINEDHFNQPEWSVRQAYLLGQKKRIRQMIRLIEGVIGDR